VENNQNNATKATIYINILFFLSQLVNTSRKEVVHEQKNAFVHNFGVVRVFCF
jgi:hypothetical protein